MSRKFGKNRSVDYRYFMIPLFYTEVKHPNNSNKQLVIIDDFHKHYVAAWRNSNTCKVGIHFLVKKSRSKGELGFIFRGKFRSLGSRVL